MWNIDITHRYIIIDAEFRLHQSLNLTILTKIYFICPSRVSHLLSLKLLHVWVCSPGPATHASLHTETVSCSHNS